VGGTFGAKIFFVPPLATLCPPLKTPFFEKNIDIFFNYVNLNLCNFLNVAKGGGAQNQAIPLNTVV